jgi:hypothetical protein
MPNENNTRENWYRLPSGRQLDPEKYKPKYYVINAITGALLDNTGSGNVTLDNQPFVLTKISVGIKEENDGQDQDGNYLVRFRDQNRYYQNDFARPGFMLGNATLSRLIPLDVEIVYQGSTTITLDVINTVARTYPSDEFTIQAVLIGFERWQK